MATTQDRGLTVRQDRTISDPREEEQLTRQLILKNATDAQLRLVLGICDRYGFDPLLKHVVIVSNNVYVTRDGLLHLAHQSGQFDGIEVTMNQAQDGEWAATCTVYRKDMNRPIRYTAFEREHKPANPGGSAWGKYPRAMLQKCSEVMALRRAFDVSVGAAEEIGYDGVTPQTSVGRVTVIEPAPEVVEAPAQHPAAGLPQAVFDRFLASVSRMAYDGIASEEILRYLNKQRAKLSADQRKLTGQLWDRIKAARKAGEPWPNPDEPTADEAPGDLLEDPALDETGEPTGDPSIFDGGVPAGYAG